MSLIMNAEQQYIDLFSQCEAMICRHSAEALNAPRATAFADFERQMCIRDSVRGFLHGNKRNTNIRMSVNSLSRIMG